MKTAISKDQALEIRRWLEKQRVPKDTVDSLLSSQNASNTHKSYRMKRQITADGWAIHFGANWARPLEKDANGEVQAEQAPPQSKPQAAPAKKAATASASKAAKPKASPSKQDDASKTGTQKIKSLGGDLLSRTFMGLAEKLKQLQIEDVDKPLMQKIAVEIDKDHLAILKKMATEKNTTVGNLIRVSVRDFIEQDH